MSTTIWDSVYTTVFNSAIFIIIVWTLWDLTSRFRGNISIQTLISKIRENKSIQLASEIYCTSCGVSNNSDALFCQKCGKKLDVENSSDKEDLPKTLKTKKTTKTKAKKKPTTKKTSTAKTKKKKVENKKK